MKILLISCKPPFPVIDGGCFATKKLIQTILSQGNSVKLLTVATQKHPFKKEEHPVEIAAESVEINTEISIGKAFKHLFKSGSFNVERFRDERMKQLILTTLDKSKFDCIIFDSLFSTPYLQDVKKVFNGKILLRSHNVESKIWKQKRDQATGFKKIYLEKIVRDLQNYEINTLNNVDRILTITEKDKIEFQSMGIQTEIDTIPVAVKTTSMVDYENNQPFFIGGMDWEPNLSAVQKAIEILHQINDSSIQFQLAGSKTEQFRGNSFVKCFGRVESSNDFMQKNGFLFAPIVSGSGVKIKILEALSAGIPVLTTSLGSAGIDKNAVVIAENDSKMIEMFKKLVQNKDFRVEIGQKGQKFVKNELSLMKIGQKLQSILND